MVRTRGQVAEATAGRAEDPDLLQRELLQTRDELAEARVYIDELGDVVAELDTARERIDVLEERVDCQGLVIHGEMRGPDATTESLLRVARARVVELEEEMGCAVPKRVQS